MKIIVFGATGGIRTLIVEQALSSRGTDFVIRELTMPTLFRRAPIVSY